MEEVLAYKNLHPETSLRDLSELSGIPKSTLGDRLKGTHDSPGVRNPGHLTMAQQQVLIDKINQYAAPRHLSSTSTPQRTMSHHDWGRSRRELGDDLYSTPS